jgi:hypothetical protein
MPRFEISFLTEDYAVETDENGKIKKVSFYSDKFNNWLELTSEAYEIEKLKEIVRDRFAEYERDVWLDATEGA